MGFLFSSRLLAPKLRLERFSGAQAEAHASPFVFRRARARVCSWRRFRDSTRSGFTRDTTLVLYGIRPGGTSAVA
jgi:hypothetical protein